ncbi:MAG: helix-turn-helix domain-containing protein [Ruminococcus sp.]
MEEIKTIVAKNITQLRQAKGLTQIELAEKLNYSDKAVSKWERGESIPDVTVLAKIAEIFEVTLDYLVHPHKEADDTAMKLSAANKKKNQIFITGISVLLVWLIATMVFVIIDLTPLDTNFHWMSFIYAVPASTIVWLIFNSVWFNRKRNYLIVSILMWSALVALHLSFLPFSANIWLIYILGIPGQVIILLWSKLKYKDTDANRRFRIKLPTKENKS